MLTIKNGLSNNYFLSFRIVMCILGGLCTFSIYGQHYFKRIEGSDQFFRQRIAQFQNGDVLICDSSTEAQRTGIGGQITMTRLDECGNVVWAKAYNRTPEYLEFKDVKINDAGEIFAYGSAYLGLNELIFLLKVDEEGQVLQFRLFRPETVDHFSYAIELQKEQLVLYGLLLDFGTQKQGFIAVFNERLNFIWAKKFAPFDSDGSVIPTQDGGFLCHSGAYFYKLDAQGELIWAKTLNTSTGIKILAGPLEVSDGYIFQIYFAGFSSFCKWNDDGDLIWESQSFPSTAIEAALVATSKGDIVATYNLEENNFSKLAYLVLQPNGNITEQYALEHETQTLGMSSIYASISEQDVIAIAGNKNAFQRETFNFLLQFPLFAPFNDNCFQWINNKTLENRSLNLMLQSFDTVVVQTNLVKLDTENIATATTNAPFRTFCTTDSATTLVQFDTLLDCGNDWLVDLPLGFSWEDRNRDNPRLLSTTGVYRAINKRDCAAPIIHNYQLRRNTCTCKVYLPTAFTPNSDQQNDGFQPYSNCNISSIQLTVYDRWGSRIYQHRDINLSWDGKINGKLIASGVYLIQLVYELMDDSGISQTGSLVQELVVLE